jgi:glycosyltransferase involved in cell wall biosynthesis
MSLPSAGQPLVTIVLPTYNRANLLHGAVKSCVTQTWKSLEIIVVDDGSSDNTAQVVEEWSRLDRRIRYVRQQNGKIPRALNTGFREAKGVFFTWTSDDNLYEPEAIELMATYLMTHSEIGLVYCDYKLIDADGTILEVSRRTSPDTIANVNSVGACFMYRRSVAEAVGTYDTEAFLAEDYDYWLRISKVAPLAHMSGLAPYLYRVHSNSLTHTREAEAEIQAARVRTKHARSQFERHQILADGYCAAGNASRHHGEFGKALFHYLRSICHKPWKAAAYRGIVATCLKHAPRGGQI